MPCLRLDSPDLGPEPHDALRVDPGRDRLDFERGDHVLPAAGALVQRSQRTRGRHVPAVEGQGLLQGLEPVVGPTEVAVEDDPQLGEHDGALGVPEVPLGGLGLEGPGQLLRAALLAIEAGERAQDPPRRRLGGVAPPLERLLQAANRLGRLPAVLVHASGLEERHRDHAGVGGARRPRGQELAEVLAPLRGPVDRDQALVGSRVVDVGEQDSPVAVDRLVQLGADPVQLRLPNLELEGRRRIDRALADRLPLQQLDQVTGPTLADVQLLQLAPVGLVVGVPPVEAAQDLSRAPGPIDPLGGQLAHPPQEGDLVRFVRGVGQGLLRRLQERLVVAGGLGQAHELVGQLADSGSSLLVALLDLFGQGLDRGAYALGRRCGAR